MLTFKLENYYGQYILVGIKVLHLVLSCLSLCKLRGWQTFITCVISYWDVQSLQRRKGCKCVAVETNKDIMNNVPLGKEANYAKYPA